MLCVSEVSKIQDLHYLQVRCSRNTSKTRRLIAMSKTFTTADQASASCDKKGGGRGIHRWLKVLKLPENISNSVIDFFLGQAWCHLADDYSDVGYLSVLVHGARGLSAQDTFCVFEFGNNRLQSHTEYKTTDPKWMRIFNW